MTVHRFHHRESNATANSRPLSRGRNNTKSITRRSRQSNVIEPLNEQSCAFEIQNALLWPGHDGLVHIRFRRQHVGFRLDCQRSAKRMIHKKSVSVVVYSSRRTILPETVRRSGKQHMWSGTVKGFERVNRNDHKVQRRVPSHPEDDNNNRTTPTYGLVSFFVFRDN